MALPLQPARIAQRSRSVRAFAHHRRVFRRHIAADAPVLNRRILGVSNRTGTGHLIARAGPNCRQAAFQLAIIRIGIAGRPGAACAREDAV